MPRNFNPLTATTLAALLHATETNPPELFTPEHEAHCEKASRMRRRLARYLAETDSGYNADSVKWAVGQAMPRMFIRNGC